MTGRARDFRNLSAGLAGGIALTLCLGQAAPAGIPPVGEAVEHLVKQAGG